MKNTRIPGHGLVGEGRPAWRKGDDQPYCECGALGPAGSTQSGARRWMVEHKAEITRLSTGYLTGISSHPEGGTVLSLKIAEETLAHMSEALAAFWDGKASEGINYLEQEVRNPHTRKRWFFTVYPGGNATPHQLRRQAERKHLELLRKVATYSNDGWLAQEARAELQQLGEDVP